MKTVKMYFFEDVEAMSDEMRNSNKLPDWRKQMIDVPEHILPLVKRIRNETSGIRISDLKTLIKILANEIPAA